MPFGRLLARGAALALSLVLGAAPPVSAATKPRKSPYVEIVGEATVVTAPRETVHKNGRKFLEFEVVLSSARAAADQPPGADRSLSLDTKGHVKVVHDLSCGGPAISLAEGDRIAIGGEYVHVPRGRDLIHFTHAADARCGGGSKHPEGYLRKLTAPATTPRPVAAVPEQAWRGRPGPAEKPYEAILSAKEKGASDADLLAKVESEHVVYSLTTSEIQQLRAAGVPERVLEAMLRSGRTPAPAATPSLTPR